MPQGISDFFRVASNLPDATPLRAAQDTVTQATHKRGVSRAENMQANTETAKAFLNAVRSHPGYANGGEVLETRLNKKIETGSPLCADEVRTIVRQLNASQARSMGEKLESAGILPKGTSSDFAKHVLATFGSLEGEHALRASVRDFLISHVIPSQKNSLMGFEAAFEAQNVPALSKDEWKAVQKALATYHNEPNVESYMKSLVVKNIAAGLVPNAPAHPEFGKGLAGLAETGIANLFVAADKDNIRFLVALPEGTRNDIMANPELLCTLLNKRNMVPLAEQGELARYVTVNQLPVSSEAEWADTLRDFMLMQSAKHMQQPLPNGLPQQLSLPLMFNPVVKHEAIALLQATVAPGVSPTQKQVDAALLQARNAFAQAHAPQLNEFLQMAANPPADLNIDPPLTLQTLPRYLNVLLSGDAILEPLLNDSQPVDADFLHNVLIYDQSMESTGDVLESVMGLDDVNKLNEGTMKLLMARRGLGETEYPAMLERGIARFGRIISELNTLSEESFKQGNDSAQRNVLSLRRVLNSTLVNTAERLTPASREALSLPVDSVAMMGALFNPFDVSVQIHELSASARDLGASMGIELPPANSAVAANAMQQQLREANVKIADATLSRILGNGKEVRAATTSFTEMARNVATGLGLNNVNPDLLEPRLFAESARTLMRELAADAAAQNATLDEGVIRSALRQSMGMEMQEMHTLMAQIDALPKPSNLSEEQHAERKRIMKDMVHLHPITDLSVLSRLMDKAAGVNAAMDKLRAPQGTPTSVASAVSTLVTEYGDIFAGGEKNVPSRNTAMACYLDMALRSSKLDADEKGAARIQEYITGAIGQSIAGSYRHFIDSDRFNAQQKARTEVALAMMTQLATRSTILVEGKAEHQPLRFAEKLGHLSEIPKQCLVTVAPSSTPIQQALNTQGVKLSPAQWDMLEKTYNALAQGMTQYQNKDRLANILANHAQKLVDVAAAKGNPQTLGMNQVAIAVMGSRLTPEEDRNGVTDGDRLCNAFVSRYTKTATAHIANVSAESIEKALRMGLANGFSFSLLDELAKPQGKITLQNIPANALELGSLGNYTESNAFGLREDFPRLGTGSITLNVNGKEQTYSIANLGGEKNIPANHPALKDIIGDVRTLAPSEAQMLRIMHTLTQAGRKCISMSMQTFPNSSSRTGAEILPMVYSIECKADNRVEVSMKSVATSPLVMEQKFLVNQDGSYEVTDFEMYRRPAVAERAAAPEVNENPARPA